MENNESELSKYDYFDVTADIGFYAYGRSLEEAYENAGLAMFNVVTDIGKVKKQESREFEIVSEDLVSLLYDYLEDCSCRILNFSSFLILKSLLKKLSVNPPLIWKIINWSALLMVRK